MIGPLAVRRLRAIWAKAAVRQKTTPLREGVRILRMRQAQKDDVVIQQLRQISKKPIESFLAHSERFSIPGRRRIVAKQIREMRQKYGSKEVRRILKQTTKNYRRQNPKYMDMINKSIY